MKLTRKGKTTVERVAELAMKLGGRHLADYGATRSRHDFTQRQLMACLILRAYLKTTYRGVLELLAVSPKLREALGLQEKLPHYTTLQKFSARSQVLAIADAMIRTIGRAAGEPEFAKSSAAMDATGLETTTASAHFQSRAGRARRKWVKVSTIVLCGSLLPLGLVLDWGPGNDKCQARELLAKASAATLPSKLYADAGYDAEWVHDQCRLDWGAESVIKPARQRADGTRSGFWRSRMSEAYLERKGYGMRWAVESFFSGLKRTMGSTLTSRKPGQLLAEAAFKVLAYTLRR
jgi:spore coat protein U-like protein